MIFVPRFDMRGARVNNRQYVDVGDLIGALYKCAAYPGQSEDSVAFARQFALHLEQANISDIPEGKEKQT